MRDRWRLFTGEIPRVAPDLLPDTAAQTAVNTRLWSGKLEAFGAPAAVPDVTLVAGVKKTIFRFGQAIDSDAQYWFSNTGDVDYTRGPVADDTQERTYFSGDGPPKVTDSTLALTGTPYPAVAYLLGLPAPSQALAAASGAASGSAVSLVAAYSYVTGWGERGPVSPVTDPVDYYQGQTLEVSMMDGPPAGAYDITHKDVWISLTDSTGSTELRFWKRIPVATALTTGVVDGETLGENVDSPSLIAPPSDLFGMGLHPNGFLYGFTKRRVCRSEVFKPYGWPVDYQDPVGDDIVGGTVIGQTIVVCTKGKTVLFGGQDPLNLSKVDCEGWQPCVSKRSIQKTTAGVVYASADGLVLVNGSGPLVVVTAGIFTRGQWQAFRPESIHSAVHDDRYFCWYDTGARRGGLIFEFAGGAVANLVQIDVFATAAFADHRRDELFLALEDGQLYKWDAGPALSHRWRSKLRLLDRPQAIGAARVRADAPVTLRMLARRDQVIEVVCTRIIESDKPVGLKGDRRYKAYCFEVETAGRIESVDVASTVFELRNG